MLCCSSKKADEPGGEIKRFRSFRSPVCLCSSRSPDILYDILQLRRSLNKLLKLQGQLCHEFCVYLFLSWNVCALDVPSFNKLYFNYQLYFSNRSTLDLSDYFPVCPSLCIHLIFESSPDHTGYCRQNHQDERA